MRLLGHLLTLLIAIAVIAGGGYYFLQQEYAKQRQVEKLQNNLLSMENDISKLRNTLRSQQQTIAGIASQVALHVENTSVLANNLDDWKKTSKIELEEIKDAFASSQKNYQAALLSSEEKNKLTIDNLAENTAANIFALKKDHLELIKSLQNQIVALADSHINNSEFPNLFETALKSFLIDYTSVNADIGSLPSGNPGKVTRDIPASIPDDAHEILVYAYVATSYVRGGNHNFRISVKRGNSKEVAFYLYAIANTQRAWSYNSDNIWLPMPSNRKIVVETNGDPLFGDWEGRVKIIAYR